MKNFYIISLILISITSTSQTVFTSALAGELPTAIQIVNDDLYVGTFYGFKVYRININNPNNVELVTDFTPTNIWKMGYDSINNDLYCYNFQSLSSIDLSQSLPITSSSVLNINGCNGFEIDNEIVYLAIGGDIYTYDINVGASSYQLIYTDTNGDIYNPRVYNNELYYALGNPTHSLYKIDLTSSNPQRVLVSSNLGFVQSSLVVNNYLYLGFESLNEILRIDLSESSLPITPVTVVDNLNGGIIGLANKDNTIYATNGTSQSIITFQDPVLSINVSNKNLISIYPNPTNEILYIMGDQINNLSFRIYSLNGVTLKEGVYNNGVIDVSNFTQGLYFIQLNQNEKTLTQSFLKK